MPPGIRSTVLLIGICIRAQANQTGRSRHCRRLAPTKWIAATVAIAKMTLIRDWRVETAHYLVCGLAPPRSPQFSLGRMAVPLRSSKVLEGYDSLPFPRRDLSILLERSALDKRSLDSCEERHRSSKRSYWRSDPAVVPNGTVCYRASRHWRPIPVAKYQIAWLETAAKNLAAT